MCTRVCACTHTRNRVFIPSADPQARDAGKGTPNVLRRRERSCPGSVVTNGPMHPSEALQSNPTSVTPNRKGTRHGRVPHVDPRNCFTSAFQEGPRYTELPPIIKITLKWSYYSSSLIVLDLNVSVFWRKFLSPQEKGETQSWPWDAPSGRAPGTSRPAGPRPVCGLSVARPWPVLPPGVQVL